MRMPGPRPSRNVWFTPRPMMERFGESGQINHCDDTFRENKIPFGVF